MMDCRAKDIVLVFVYSSRFSDHFSLYKNCSYLIRTQQKHHFDVKFVDCELKLTISSEEAFFVG